MLTIDYISVWLRERGIPNEVVDERYNVAHNTIYVTRLAKERRPWDRLAEWVLTIRVQKANSTNVDVWGPSLLFSGYHKVISLADPTSLDQIVAAVNGWRKIKFATLNKVWKWKSLFDHRSHPFYNYSLSDLDNWLRFAPEVIRLIETNTPCR